MKKLFLDDVRQPKDCTYMPYNKSDYLSDDWDIVRNYDEFCEYIKNCKTPADLPYLISFDHDLADEHYTPEIFHDDYILSKEYQDNKRDKYKEKTGEDCARYLVDHLQSIINFDSQQYIPKFLVHSMNPIGADRIRFILYDYERYCKIQRLKVKDSNTYMSQFPYTPEEVFKQSGVGTITTPNTITIPNLKRSMNTELKKKYQAPKYEDLIQKHPHFLQDYKQDAEDLYKHSFNDYLKEAKEREYEAMKASSSFFDKIRKRFK